MSILDALKTFKQERESIDDVAALPQALIMQMAQKGQIPKTDLPMILARKAEIAQTQAQMNALRQQQTQGAQPTLMEKMIAANAQQEAPQELTDVGIASNPVPEMRMAGGGIVAFENGGGVSDRWKALGNDSTPYYAEDFRRDAAAFFDPVVGFLTNREGRQRQAAREFKRAQDMQTADQPVDYPMYKPRPVAKAALADPTMGETTMGGTTKTNPPLKANNKLPISKAPADPYAELKELFKEQATERATARKEARDMSLLETGLAMIGGESPYAGVNIGKAGAQGAKGYSEKLTGLRKEERERARDYADVIKSQADYGQKERTIGIQQQVADTQRLIANKTPDQIALVQEYAKSKRIPFDQALQEVFGAKNKEDPLAAMIAERIREGGGQNIDRTSLAKNMERWKNDYGITPTK